MKHYTLTLCAAICAVLFLSHVDTSAQNVGVDISSPLQKLDVAGGLRIGNTTNGLAGSIRWTGTQFEGHDGTAWTPFSFSGSSDNWSTTGNSGTVPATNFLGTTDNIDLRIRTNNIERAVFNTDGNLGIGTNSPTHKLDVFGGIKATNPAASPLGSDIILSSPAGDLGIIMNRGNGSGASQQRWDIKITSDNALRFRSQNTTDYFAFTNVGNLGIGTNTPAAKLQVGGSSTAFPQIRIDGVGPNGIQFADQGVDGLNLLYRTGTDQLRVETPGGTTYFQVNASDGNVGIATTSPAAKLHVVGSIRMVDGNQAVGLVPVSDANGTMVWSNLDEIRDADNDTKIQVEESTDEDIIRFDAQGNQLYAMRRMAGGSPWLEVNSTNTFVGSAISTAVNGAGIYNTAVGYQAAQNLTTGQKNTYFGDNSGGFNTIGNWNTMIGTVAGQFNNGGDSNTMVGANAGRNNLTGSGNVFLGNGAGENETTSNKLYIDNSSTATPLLYGDFSSNLLRVNGTLNVNNAYDMPTVAGTNGFVLQTNGAGDATWVNPNTIGADVTTASNGLTETGNDIQLGGPLTANTTITQDNAEVLTVANSGTGNTVINLQNTGDFDVQDNGTSAFFVRDDGNVGIGTSAPSEKLDVFGNIDLSAVQPVLKFSATGTPRTSNLTATFSPTTTAGQTLRVNLSDNTSTGTSEIMRLQGDGNVGIGISSPMARLDINGVGDDATSTALRLRSGNVGLGTLSNQIVFGQNGQTIQQHAIKTRHHSSLNERNAIDFYVWQPSDAGNAVGTKRVMTIDGKDNGMVGIGVLQPLDELHVVGSIRMVDGNQTVGYIPVSDANGTMTWTNPTTITTSYVDEIRDADNDTKIQVEETADEDIIRFDMAGTEHFTMTRGRLSVFNTGASVFIGQNAGVNDDWTNNNNIGIGINALNDNVTGGGNTAIGSNTLANSTTSDNVAIGENTLTALTTGQGNTAVGKGGFQTNSTGSFNTSLGLYAGYFNQGSSNVFLGHRAGQDETGSNKLYIDNTNTATPLIYGDFSTDVLRINGTLNVNNAYNMPTVAGTNGFVLQTNGAGVATWVNPNTIGADVTTASNGLTETGNDIQLGGPLTANTTITQDNAEVLTLANSGTANTIVNLQGTGDFDVQDNGTSALFVRDDAFVGIGTNAPTQKLDVRGDVIVNNGASSVITIAGNRNGGNTPYNTVNTSAPARLDFQNRDPGNANTDYIAGRIESVNRAGNNDGELRFYTSQNMVLQEVMNINQVGNVGIGTIASQKLHVVGNIRMVDGSQAAGFIPVSDANGTMTWTNPTTITTSYVDEIRDADNDTKIQVEESADEDIIRFDMAGTEHFTMTRGRLSVLNTGASVFIGQNAGVNDDWSNNNNIGIGQNALNDNVTGGGNTAIGSNTLANSTTSDNVAIGENTLTALTTGKGNTAVGKGGFQTNSTGSFNTSLGLYAGYNNQGSSNVFLGHRAGQDEAGSNKLYIDNTNTATPLIYGDFSTDVLRINGTLNVNNAYNMPTVAGTNGFVLQTNGAGVASWVNANTLTVTETDPQVSSATTNLIPKWNGTTLVDGIVFDNGTNIGIGTTSPTAKLDIVGTLNGSGGATFGNNVVVTGDYYLTNTNGTGTNNPNFRIDGFADKLYVIAESSGTGPATGTEIRFRTSNSNTAASDRVTINNNGNVGVGTSNPTELLHVQRNSSDAIIKVESPGSSYEARIMFQKNGANTANVGFYPGTAELRLRTGQATGILFEPNGVERMRVHSDGNVGIGTSLPVDELHVVGNIRMVDGNQAAGRVLVSDANGTGTWTAATSLSITETDPQVSSATSNHIPKWNGTTLVDGLAFDDGTNIGVGVSAPVAHLDVKGTNAGTSSLLLRSGNATTSTSSNQITFGYDGSANYRSAIKTRHDSGTPGNNAIDFFLWDLGTDAPEVIGTKRVMTLNGSGATGSVGIGTSTPGEELHVVGNIRMVDGNQAAGRVMVSDANGTGTWTAATALTVTETDPQVSSATTNQIPKWDGTTLTDGIITDNGTNVGIGFASPAYDLDIFRSEVAVNQRIYADNALGIGQLQVGSNGGGHVNLVANSSAAAHLGIPAGVSGLVTDHTDMVFATGTGGTGTEQMRITTTGSVGIGTGAATPGAPLHISVNSTSSQVLVTPSATTGQDAAISIRGARNGSTTVNHAQLKFENYDLDLAVANTLGTIVGKVTNATTNVGDLVFNNSTNGSTISETMRLTSGGNVGIGSTGPAARLEVITHGTAGTGALISQFGSTASAGRIRFYDETASLGPIINFNAGNVGQITGAGDIALSPTGNVGIGTTTPTQAKLVVNGSQNNTLSYGYLNSGGNTGTSTNQTVPYSIYASARIAATEFNAYSDQRIKSIKGITDGATDLNTLMGIEVTDYTFIDKVEKGNGVQKKVIAQQVEEVYPQAVGIITDVVPDIYKLAEITDGRIAIANTLKAGEKVRLVLSDRTELAEVLAADADGFSVALKDNGQVFVFGREVSDFRTVDYEALSMLNISATQELVRMINGLQRENEAMKANFTSLSSDVEMLKAMLNAGSTAGK